MLETVLEVAFVAVFGVATVMFFVSLVACVHEFVLGFRDVRESQRKLDEEDDER